MRRQYMNISLKWLKTYVPVKHAAAKVAEVLTFGGFEVESIQEPAKALQGLVVGQIKTIVDHAEADRLSVCTVDIGKKAKQQIVCGAKNIKPGDKVPVALPGMTLPGGLTIEERKIRGTESAGMLCAEDELGLGDDHSGILILDPKARIGQPVATALGLNDSVLDVTVSPQRADAQSMIGLAREYAALTNQTFKEPKVAVTESKHKISAYLKVRVADYNLCPKYTARVIRGVTVRPSPAWLQARLRAAGHTPINNIVDVTNFVLLEYGQPLHAFDAKKIEGDRIVVKKAGRKQSFDTLDHETREITSDMLMIWDAKQPIAIAGVIGGEHSAISEKTTDIILESAIFKPLSIRKTRQKLGLVTDASLKFERGIWWGLPERALDRAAELIAETAGGTIAAGSIVVTKPKTTHKPTVLTVSPKAMTDVIGAKLSTATIVRYLTKLSFTVEKLDDDRLRLTVPEWRMDIHVMADVVEEIGRMYGWNKLKPRPIAADIAPTELLTSFQWERKIRRALAACGMTEMMNYSFYGENLFTQFGWKPEDHYRIENPMNKEQEYMRISLVPGLYVTVLKLYQQQPQLALFEVGRVFYRTKKAEPDEHRMAAGIIYDRQAKRGDQRPIRQLQGIIRALVRQLGVTFESLSFSVNSDDAQVVDIEIDGHVVGWYGWLIQHEEKLGQPPVWFEVDIDKLVDGAQLVRRFTPIPEHPAVVRDMTFQMPVRTSFFSVRDATRQVSELITDVAARDLYPLDDEHRKATIRITYQAADRTLHTHEVNAIEKKILTMMTNKFNATLDT